MAARDERKPLKKLKRVARALYEGDAKDAEDALAAFGLKLENQTQDTECWPDNWLPLQVFKTMDTQWNVGQNAVIGLRYEALPVVMDVMGVKKKARAGMLQSLRIMEQEALQVLNQKWLNPP
jgi:hypothetical protein